MKKLPTYQSDKLIAEFIVDNPDYAKKYLRATMRETRLKERNIEIAMRYITSDESYKEVGEHYGLTLERIRQITHKLMRVIGVLLRRIERKVA